MNPLRSITVAALASILMTASMIAAPAASAQTGSFILNITRHSDGSTTTVTLTCGPTGGTHPDGAAACTDLTNASGNIALIPPASAACLSYYDPVTAQAQGTWLGLSKSYSKDFTNRGCANVATGGHVFRF